jgi:hypothetical protein
MSNKFQPGEEMFDEVQGHGIRGNGLVPEDADTEGHAISSGRALPDEETEGHGLHHAGYAVPDDEDTEGHGRFNVALPKDDEDGEDTEGHRRSM